MGPVGLHGRRDPPGCDTVASGTSSRRRDVLGWSRGCGHYDEPAWNGRAVIIRLEGNGRVVGPGAYCHLPAGEAMGHALAGGGSCLFVIILDGAVDVEPLGNGGHWAGSASWRERAGAVARGMGPCRVWSSWEPSRGASQVV